uniref:ARC105/Med15 mediator subunit C-terminal domain-containing protein n=1 Tax=Oryza punctata TaxID=4537 RepID=A0A0E0ML16_ORYPU
MDFMIIRGWMLDMIDTTLAGLHVAERAYWKEFVDRVLKDTGSIDITASNLAVPTRLPVELQVLIKVIIHQILNTQPGAIPPLAFYWCCNQLLQHLVNSVGTLGQATVGSNVHGQQRCRAAGWSSGTPERLADRNVSEDGGIEGVGWRRNIREMNGKNGKIRETNASRESPRTLKPTGQPNPSTVGKRIQNNQQEQPAKVTISHPWQNITDRRSAYQQSHIDNLVNHEEDETKRQKEQSVDIALSYEINLINAELFDTVIRIDSHRDGGTVIKFSYTAVSLARDMELPFTAYGASPLKPAKLFVPADYPRSSPVLCINDDDGDEQHQGMYSVISGIVDKAFRRALRKLPVPMSIRDMARQWGISVRTVMSGGGTFSTGYGQWGSCTDE